MSGRIRDPLHGLITIERFDPFESMIWNLIDTPEFQRLRRIKQLGFSEFVYPGATHTRFSHCIGVFHTARQLVAKLRKLLGESDFDQDRANVAVCAALLHDVGHGPFSHTFEGVEKTLKHPKSHESWTSEIVVGGPQLPKILNAFRPNLASDIAELLKQDTPADIYASIISSQFDADRVDYLRRDKLMTGTAHGGFDWDWLLNNLEIDKAYIGQPGSVAGEESIKVDVLVLGRKGLSAAEGYLLGRLHLYTQVYLHKSTRGLEKLMGEFLRHVAQAIEEGRAVELGLDSRHPIVEYFSNGGRTLQNYLRLDDSVVFSAMQAASATGIGPCAKLAERIINRRLYRCLDIGALFANGNEDDIPHFIAKVDERFSAPAVMKDRTKVSPYKFEEIESPGALSKVLIRKPGGSGNFVDVARLSSIVSAMESKAIDRVYADSDATYDELCKIAQEVRS